MGRINGSRGPAKMPVSIVDLNALKDQYIRHNDTQEIMKIIDVGREGVTAKLAEGFGGPVLTSSVEYSITWASLKYKHTIMAHVTDIASKDPGVI